jgi:flavin-binding protein dodecin
MRHRPIDLFPRSDAQRGMVGLSGDWQIARSRDSTGGAHIVHSVSFVAASVTLLLPRRRTGMSVARITEISATSEKSFEDAIQQGVNRATKTLRNVKSAWIKEQEVSIEGERIKSYRVNMQITFVLDD